MDKYSDINNQTHMRLGGDLFWVTGKMKAQALMWIESAKYWGTSVFTNAEVCSRGDFNKLQTVCEYVEYRHDAKCYVDKPSFQGQYVEKFEDCYVASGYSWMVTYTDERSGYIEVFSTKPTKRQLRKCKQAFYKM